MKQKIPERGDVFWVKLDSSIGSEIKKTRPALVVSNNIGNEVSARIVVLPITSQAENVYPFEQLIVLKNKKAKVMADQIRSIDKKRLGDFIGKITYQELEKVEKALKIVLDLT